MQILPTSIAREGDGPVRQEYGAGQAQITKSRVDKSSSEVERALTLKP